MTKGFSWKMRIFLNFLNIQVLDFCRCWDIFEFLSNLPSNFTCSLHFSYQLKTLCFLFMWLCTHTMHEQVPMCLWRPEEDIRPAAAWVGSCEPPGTELGSSRKAWASSVLSHLSRSPISFLFAVYIFYIRWSTHVFSFQDLKKILLGKRFVHFFFCSYKCVCL